MTKILVNGAKGKMGQLICDILHQNNYEVLTREVGQKTEQDLKDVKLIIDFSSPNGAEESFNLACKIKSAFLCGTTNLPQTLLDSFKQIKDISVFYSPNVSIGVALFKKLLLNAQRSFEGYSLSLHEVHHTQKKDAPSGTAKNLAQALNFPINKITYERIGAVAGTHTLTLTSQNKDEEIILTHKVLDRKMLAQSAVKVAIWLLAQKVGYYTMDDFIK